MQVPGSHGKPFVICGTKLPRLEVALSDLISAVNNADHHVVDFVFMISQIINLHINEGRFSVPVLLPQQK